MSREVKYVIGGTIYGNICEEGWKDLWGIRLDVEFVWPKRRKADRILILTPKKSIIHISNQTRKRRILMSLCMGSGAILILDIIAISLDTELRVRAKITSQIFSVQALTQQGAKMLAYRDIPAFSQHC
jgi:hypothetical protein